MRAEHRVGRPGVTMTELLIVAVLMGILAAIALPNYRRSVERGYQREAQDLLLTIYHGERSYFFAHRGYYGPLAPGSPNDEWRLIFMDNPNIGSIPVEFQVDAPGNPAAAFTATATRRQGAQTKTMTINEERQWCGANDDPTACEDWAD